MSCDRRPPDVEAFVRGHLLSVDAIELLTAMIDTADRWWDARLIHGELGIAVVRARGLLDHLAGLNLFDIRVTDEVRYRFHPGTSELAQTISRLVACSRTDRAAVVRVVAPTARRGVRDCRRQQLPRLRRPRGVSVD